MEERRKGIRREADQDLLDQLRDLQDRLEQSAGPGKEAKRARRRTIRHNCKVNIEMLISHSAGLSDTWSTDSMRVSGRVLDLSLHGASLFVKQSMDTGQPLRLSVDLRGDAVIHAGAEVRWVKAIPEKGGYATGVQFDQVSARDQTALSRFLQELDATAGL